MGNSDDETKKMDTTDLGENSRASVQVDAATKQAIPVELQPFWPSNPRAWFQLAEIQFNAAKILPMVRYTKTIAALPAQICDRIIDIIANPPTEDHYENLKDRLITRLAPSDEQQLESLLAGEELGDRRPSEALARIQALAGNNFSDKIVRSLWTRKMPHQIRLTLVAHQNTSIADSAKTADQMYEILQVANVHETKTQPSRGTSRGTSRGSSNTSNSSYRSNRDGNRRSPVISVEERLDRIEARLDNIFRARTSRSRERRFPSRGRSSSRDRSQQRGPINGVCWFHTTFGNQAKRCRAPCKYGQSTSTAVMDIDHNSKN